MWDRMCAARVEQRPNCRFFISTLTPDSAATAASLIFSGGVCSLFSYRLYATWYAGLNNINLCFPVCARRCLHIYRTHQNPRIHNTDVRRDLIQGFMVHAYIWWWRFVVADRAERIPDIQNALNSHEERMLAKCARIFYANNRSPCPWYTKLWHLLWGPRFRCYAMRFVSFHDSSATSERNKTHHILCEKNKRNSCTRQTHT